MVRGKIKQVYCNTNPLWNKNSAFFNISCKNLRSRIMRRKKSRIDFYQEINYIYIPIIVYWLNTAQPTIKHNLYVRYISSTIKIVVRALFSRRFLRLFGWFFRGLLRRYRRPTIKHFTKRDVDFLVRYSIAIVASRVLRTTSSHDLAIFAFTRNITLAYNMYGFWQTVMKRTA